MKRLHHPAPASPTNPLPVKASYYPHQLDTPSSREYPRTSQPSISTTSVGHNNPPNHLNGKRRRINRWAYSIRSIPNRTTGREEYPRPSFLLFFQTHSSSLNTLSLLFLLVPWGNARSTSDPLSCFLGLWAFFSLQFSYKKASFSSFRTKRGFIPQNYIFPRYTNL